MKLFNKQSLSLLVLSTLASVFGLSSVTFAQDAEEFDSVEVPEFSDDLEALSGGTNSAAAVFIESDTVSAGAAFGEQAAGAIATEDGAAALGTSSLGGEVELESKESETEEALEEEELEVSVEFFEFEADDDDDDDDDDD